MISSEMISIIGPALVAGLMIALTHAPFGIEVLKRGIIFIDLALAQIAGLGFVLADIVLHDASHWVMQCVALLIALATVVFFHKLEKAAPTKQEAVIGVSYVLAASVAMLLLEHDPHGGERIQHLLSGHMLFITWQDVIIHMPVYSFILAVFFLKPVKNNSIGFYVLFAVLITSSVQLVGVYVVFSSLILPALAAEKSSNHPYKTAWLCGIVSVTLGIGAAVLSDMPAGPVIVVSYTITTIGYTQFSSIWKRRSGDHS